jgi:hypothetical protein
MSTIERLKPAAPKPWLHALSGIVWSAVGVMLLRWTCVWLRPLSPTQAWLYAGAGICLAVGINLFFSRMANKNISRIGALPSRPCLFAFQAWTSYPLVVFMVALGLTLRASPIPKPWLAILYAGIGGGLILASLRYFMYLAKTPN